MKDPSDTYIKNVSDGDFYEKFCLCGLDYNEVITDTVIEYNSALQGTALYTNNNVYKNSRLTHCPINHCEILAAGCNGPLTAPMSEYVSVDDDDNNVPPGPWAIRINKITQPGYSFDDVCYRCTNGE